MPLVQATGLTKRFGDFTAVDDVGFSVERGEVTGFLGPNGAGKSTTMKMLAGFLPPDRGTAEIAGFDVARSPVQAKRMLGYLPEGAPAYADMSTGAYLSFIGRMHGLDGARLRERLGEMADRIGLADVWNRPIDALSKGFKRRVGIAQALVHDPDVLILDEPTDGLDPNQKHEMRTLIRAIAASKAIIVSTHILEEVEAVCTRAIIISGGRIVANETPHDLVARNAGPAQVQVRVATANADGASARLAAIAGVDPIEIVDTGGDETRLRLSGGARPITPAEVSALLTASGIEVREVGLWRPSLEDVFRRITRPD
ncbi:MAG: ABC transporter ATP-binding protein [Burkholderiaceae bacterium]